MNFQAAPAQVPLQAAPTWVLTLPHHDVLAATASSCPVGLDAAPEKRHLQSTMGDLWRSGLQDLRFCLQGSGNLRA